MPTLQTIFDSIGGKLNLFKFVPIEAQQTNKQEDAYNDKFNVGYEKLRG